MTHPRKALNDAQAALDAAADAEAYRRNGNIALVVVMLVTAAIASVVVGVWIAGAIGPECFEPRLAPTQIGG